MPIITSEIEKQQKEALAKALALQNSNNGSAQAQQLFNSKYGNINESALGQYTAQDQLLNQSLTDTEAQNYQAFLKAQQSMSNRGLGDSGFASDAYARLQMDANRQYNTMRADTAQKKANIFSQYAKDVDSNLKYDRQKQDEEDLLQADQTGFIWKDGTNTGQKTAKQLQIEYEQEQQRKAFEAQQAQIAFEQEMAQKQFAAQQAAASYARQQAKNSESQQAMRDAGYLVTAADKNAMIERLNTLMNQKGIGANQKRYYQEQRDAITASIRNGDPFKYVEQQNFYENTAPTKSQAADAARYQAYANAVNKPYTQQNFSSNFLGSLRNNVINPAFKLNSLFNR